MKGPLAARVYLNLKLSAQWRLAMRFARHEISSAGAHRSAMSYCAAAVALAFASVACAHSPTPAPERGWQVLSQIRFAVFSATSRRVHDLSLTCEGDTVTLYHRIAPERAGANPQLTLSSGGVSVTLPSTHYEEGFTPPPDSQSSAAAPVPVVLVVQAGLRSDTPALEAFLRGGELRVQSGEQSLDASADAEELGGINALVASCREPRQPVPDQPMQESQAPD